ncbi:hypothetical protein [Alloactinosynnema sp. L-07]|uniref:hypothetical protein n=1 Tax=Alloactinosynnema sp. L-07 TaxID=1653480 RepID=UPI00065EFD23|nr:hypothetical protein [Alloactinosynnema sp. L-07]CRK55428.1 hypothetical protein [Alloactinosynnema sp. L-07]
MTAAIPVPVDVLELVVRELRPALAARLEPVAAGVKVSTVVSTSAAHDAGPPSLPWVLVAVDGHTWGWPAVQRAVIRLTTWHTSAHTAAALCGLVVGLLCATRSPGALLAVEPVAAPVAGIDPYTAAPLATAAVAVRARTPRP